MRIGKAHEYLSDHRTTGKSHASIGINCDQDSPANHYETHMSCLSLHIYTYVVSI